MYYYIFIRAIDVEVLVSSPFVINTGANNSYADVY